MSRYLAETRRTSRWVAALAVFLLALASPSAANAGNQGNQPGATLLAEETYANITYDGTLLRASGSTVGWSTGTITIRMRVYYAGQVQHDRGNTCWNSTFCTVPSWEFCPIPGSGVWSVYVTSSGPNGTDDAADAVAV